VLQLVPSTTIKLFVLLSKIKPEAPLGLSTQSRFTKTAYRLHFARHVAHGWFCFTQKLCYSFPCSFRLFPLQSIPYLHQSLFQPSHHHNDNHPPQHPPPCSTPSSLKRRREGLKRQRAFLSWIFVHKIILSQSIYVN
jgi:hypothetical protein